MVQCKEKLLLDHVLFVNSSLYKSEHNGGRSSVLYTIKLNLCLSCSRPKMIVHNILNEIIDIYAICFYYTHDC